MKLKTAAVLLVVCAFAVLFFSGTVSAADEPDVYIDSAFYSVRSGKAAVNVELGVFVPECAAEGTLLYDSSLLTLKSVNYDKQLLNLSYKDIPERGVINIACYGTEPYEQIETVTFVFSADNGVGTTELSLGDFTLCDSEDNITILKPDVPLVLELEKDAVALNQRIDRTDTENDVSGSSGSVTVRERPAVSGSGSVSEKSGYAGTADASQQNSDGVYFYERDVSEYVAMFVFAGVIIAVLASSVISGFMLRKRK